ncbi:MAG: EAL domain-containing protein [Oscillospiraceae bacterium]|jgi:diguanylate cyclase (GGDEF)-like protein|nr:EAL domain-containing protein [Oscillospiraceae bacterium]
MQALRKVLVVEDSPLNSAILCEILSGDYDVLSAENGQVALDILQEYGESVSLILLDIIMPVMDGYTFLRIIKADATLSQIPVIVMTQNDDESDEVAALSQGAADFVAKPYRPKILLQRAANIINLRETASIMNMVKYDRLTGLYGKEYFYQQVKQILQHNPGKSYDLVCSNIENFKLINDVFGNAAGDKLLIGIAEVYNNTIGSSGTFSRLNSDHFACLCEHGSAVSEEIFALFMKKANDYLKSGRVDMKWGIYHIVDQSLSAEQMCDRALLAAQSIKGQYGKAFAYYDSEIRNRLIKNQSITDSMEAALREGQFQVYLQPKYRLRGNELVGAEALVRWIHPKWGFLSPAEFIPIFESNGFITTMDQFVWDKTCSILKDWDTKGYPKISISVNVSRADIYNVDLPDILRKIIEKYDLPISRLHLEITESAYTENPGQLIGTVESLRGMGFIVEMDDFGSGYSSLNMLNELPIDILKLDMKFVQSEMAKAEHQGIMQFIIGLARWMNLEVVAEGVETQAQMGRLKEIGCDYAQGYYYSKPVPAHEFEKLFKVGGNPAAEIDAGARPILSGQPVFLIADEDDAYRTQVRAIFEGDYQVVEARNAQQVLNCLAAHRGSIKVILVSMALSTPGNPDLLKLIKGDITLWDVPVIATSRYDMDMERRALSGKADDYIVKPHRIDSLRERINRAIKAAGYRERERSLQDAAYRDYLTGLLNRRGLQVAINAISEASNRIAFYVLDLDDLKIYNDRGGHSNGDEVLRQFSTVLKEQTRGEDIIARLGGDEFVVIMRQMPSGTAALTKGERICDAVRQCKVGADFSLSCSVGVALMRPGESFDDVMHHADQALYQAKKMNKGNCCLWTETSQGEA